MGEPGVRGPRLRAPHGESSSVEPFHQPLIRSVGGRTMILLSEPRAQSGRERPINPSVYPRGQTARGTRASRLARSGVSQRPKFEPYCRSSVWSRPLSASRSNPVKWLGLGSPQVPEVVRLSPNGRLVMVSQRLPEASVRTRSVPSQSAWLKYVALFVHPRTLPQDQTKTSKEQGRQVQPYS